MNSFSNRRNLIKLVLDLGSLFLGLICALILKHELNWLEVFSLKGMFLYGTVFLTVYMIMKLESKSWSYSSVEDIQQIVIINIVSILIYGLMRAIFIENLHITTSIIILAVVTMFQLASRYLFRYRRYIKSNISSRSIVEVREKAIIYGAGEAGATLVLESKKNKNFPYEIVGFIDDASKKMGVSIHHVKVLGTRKNLKNILERAQAKVLIIAISNLESKEIKKVVEKIADLEIEVKILPGMDKIIEGDLINQVKDVSIEDLLGRPEIKVNGEEIRELIDGKTIFVTGGAGSIGSELARQIAKHNPKNLVTIDINENAIYFLELELKRKFPELNLISEICNVREKEKVELLFSKYRPQVVFHAAAHKHVPLMEHNPEEAIKNNIFGTKNVAEAADKYGIERFVLISTDKAVNPTNIMGATKRGCELIVEGMNKRSNTKYMAVRFGNVLGSNGSVIPIFKNLIAEGKNLTITHQDITRYFMTIPEAAQLVIEAGTMGTGGEIFILDMGEPVRIVDLAKSMIRLSKADVEIEIVGLRPGEKLYEELLYDVNSATKTANKKIFITKIDEGHVDLEEHIEKLKAAIKVPNILELKELMKKFIVSYREPEHHKRAV